MVENKGQIGWEDRLMKEARRIVSAGQGKLELNVGPYKADQTSILVVAGVGHRFFVDRIDED